MRRIFAIAGAVAASAAFLGGAAGASAATVKKAGPTGLPIIRDQLGAQGVAGLPTYSLNWSGYAAESTTSKFNSVFSTFVQPAATCDGQTPESTSNWVGLDGFTSGTVEQDGTSITCHDGTTPVYKAWYEMYPANTVNVFTIKPGDVIAASVKYKAKKFVLTISDLTSGKSYTDTAGCNSCQRSSAEWISERPAFCDGPGCNPAVIAALPDFGTSTMSNNTASAGTLKNAPISAFEYFPIAGVYNLDDNEAPDAKGFISVDGVSDLAADGSFTLTYNRAGMPLPITL